MGDYEIELVASTSEHDWHEAQLATLTGLSKAEVYEAMPAEYRGKDSFRSRGYIDCARALGFNTNQRFIKWDPKTPWPCIMRVQVPDEWGWKGRWWSLIYHDGMVYDVSCPPHERCFQLWQRDNPGCRVTSMLQVWMDSTTTPLLASER